ncbi:LysE/ArgO family amino acid transporter [Companilactobacillus mishanensis]|uniref:LysE/ArgO family amino acid transporter n=1 Tax=Companilactobacillus mishanensis TaxID=2486008 RepID=UPI001296C439|nr:LysE family transporter [Companilactobacillus mishanensis]MQS89674.1 amino acid transporter [Companilactobacillus mishanensis]
MNFFLQGLTMGLAYVIPIGMQNLFVIDSALTNTRKRALLNALIVIFFDVALSLSCFFGIGVLMQHYQWLKLAILLIGSLIVIYIGVGLIQSGKTETNQSRSTTTLKKSISTAFVVTWFNPQAIIDGTMMLGAFRVTLPTSSSTPFITGVSIASVIWFTGLTLLISFFSDWFNPKALRIINLICGVIIIGYGIKLLFNFFQLILH